MTCLPHTIYVTVFLSHDTVSDTCIPKLNISAQTFEPATFNPLPDDKFQTSKLKDFADDNLNFEENGRNLFKPVENTMGKEEIARYEQFLLFPQCFQKACFPGASKGVNVWEWVNSTADTEILSSLQNNSLAECNTIFKCPYNV